MDCIHGIPLMRWCQACITTPVVAAETLSQSARADGERLAKALMDDVIAGLMVLNERGVTITEAQAKERAANIVCGLLGNCSIKERK